MLNISQRNKLIKRFIDTFCIDSSDEKDWFVGIHDKNAYYANIMNICLKIMKIIFL